MNSRYILTREAAENLADIAEHIASAGSQAVAEHVVREIQRAFELLAEQPGIGHVREDLSPNSAVRFWVVFSYLIAFVPGETPLPIVAIAHGSRDPELIAEQLRSAVRRPEDP